VAGGATSIAKPGKVYDVSHLQFFQADQLRGIGGTASPRAGRRVIAQLMHSDQGRNPVLTVPAATAIATDGSIAAFVPARRAMSWQLTNNADPVVRERYWLTLQPGEVRVCASCHGINQKSQTNATEPQNKPEALRQVLRAWKAAAVNLGANWNLVGNSVNAPLDVAQVFGNSTNVASVWKWVAATGKWAFYAPALSDGGALYAAGKGYDFLTNINAGDGFWVDAKQAFTAQLPSGRPIVASDFQDRATPPNKLVAGWSLIAIGDSKTPSAFNKAVGLGTGVATAPGNIAALWKWDNPRSNWYFYAPSLEAAGTLENYITSKGYLDFGSNVLEPTTGFWVNRP
jgi:hypothetical protein